MQALETRNEFKKLRDLIAIKYREEGMSTSAIAGVLSIPQDFVVKTLRNRKITINDVMKPPRLFASHGQR
jgi:predicted transcriptional regulator